MNWERGFKQANKARCKSVYNPRSKRVGAALFVGNKLVSLGWNMKNKTHPIFNLTKSNKSQFYKYNNGIHAEVMAINKRQHFDKPSKSILYIYRELSNGNPGCSIPCSICLKHIIKNNINIVRCFNQHGNPIEIKIHKHKDNVIKNFNQKG